MKRPLVMTGLVAILGQVVLLRELNVAYFGTELIYILAFAFWLLGTAAGAASGRRRPPSGSDPVWRLLVLCSLLVPADLVLIRGLRQLLGEIPGAYPSFGRQLAGMALILLPAAWLLGLLLQKAAARYVARGRTLAGAYAVESAGGLLGGALATFLLAAGVANFSTGLLCGILGLAGALPPGSARRFGAALKHLIPVGKGDRIDTADDSAADDSAADEDTAIASTAPSHVFVGGVVFGWLILVTALLLAPTLDFHLTAWNHPDLVETFDTPYSRVSVTARDDQIAVFQNDMLAFENEGTAAEEFVHLTALQHPAPRSVLLLGGGVEGLAAEALKHEPDRIDYVEPDRELVRVLPRYLMAEHAAALVAPQLRVVVADPRRFLARSAAAPASYDLILSGMPEPASGRANRFYTREFFRMCADRLSAQGVLGLRLRTDENLWSARQARRAASIHNALREVFPSVVVLPGTTNLVLASLVPLTRDPAVLAARLRERAVTTRLVGEEFITYLYTNDRFTEIAERLTRSGASTPVNSDLRPICYQYTLLLWLDQFFPALALHDTPLWRPDVPGWICCSYRAWGGVAALLVVVWWLRRTPARRRWAVAFVAGLAAMAIETALLLAYQSGTGVLYRDLGLLLTMFMAGLALGAGFVDRWASGGLARRRTGDGDGVAAGVGEQRVATGITGVWLIVLFLLWCMLIWFCLRGGLAQQLAVNALLLVGSGALVAALFGFAGLRGQPDQQRVVAPLLAADLLGGCVGSLLATLLLVPVCGLAGTILVVSGALAVLLVLI